MEQSLAKHSVFDFQSPATVPALLSTKGVFGKRLFKRNEFIDELPITAHCV